MADGERIMAGLPGALPIGTEPVRGSSDQSLLERFVVDRDETAFASLVGRYGRSVWGVCRRLLAQEQDAEDAFQAVFLVLARKAGSIREGQAVGSWLYGVAYRTAMKARQIEARRAAGEKMATVARPEPAPSCEAAWRELQRQLDEELQRLAERHRAPFILCCLEGMSRAEAARELGWKEGTLSSRLAQARKLLQTRLARRGVSITGVLTAAALFKTSACAAAPVGLVETTAAAAAAPAAVCSPAATALANDVIRAMAVSKLSVLLGVLAALTLLAAGMQGAEPTEPDTFVPPPTVLIAPVNEQVMTVEFSRDGKRLVTAGGLWDQRGQIKVWDMATATERFALRGVPPLRSAVFSPDGQFLATCDFGGWVRLRDPDTGAERASAPGLINCLDFSPNGTLLVGAGLDKTVKTWTVPDLKVQAEYVGHTGKVLSVAFFHHRQAFVTGSGDNTARVWDVRTGKQLLVLQGHRKSIEGVAVSPDDKVIATASWDQTIRLWDAGTGEQKAVLEVSEGRAYTVAFSPDGALLASGAGDSPWTNPTPVRLWNVATAKLVAKLDGHAGTVWHVAFSADGRLLASGSADKTVKLWDVKTLKEVTFLSTAAPQPKPVRALAYAADAGVVGLAVGEETLELRDAQTAAVLRVLRGHAAAVTCLAFAPDGRTVATGSADKTIKLWDRASGAELRTCTGHTGPVGAVAFSPDGQKLASGSDDQSVRIWATASGTCLATLTGHEASVRAVAFAPDGLGVASGSVDRTVRWWDLGRYAERCKLQGHHGTVRAVLFSPRGTLASASEDGTIKLWDPVHDKELSTLRGHNGELWALALSPGGQTLVSAGQDRTVRVWDAVTGAARGTLKGHKEPITALTIHPQGQDLLSASLDTTVLRWQGAQGQDAVARALANDASGENEPADPSAPDSAARPRRWLVAALLVGMFIVLGLTIGLALRHLSRRRPER